MTEDKELLTIEEASTYLNLQISFLKSLIETNDIPYCNPTKDVYYFKKSELLNWVFKSKNETVEDKLSVIDDIYYKISLTYDIQKSIIKYINEKEEKFENNLNNSYNNIIISILLAAAIATVIIKWL